MKKIEYLKAIREKRIRECRESFWEFCKEMSPTFKNGKKIYREDVSYLKDYANFLQDFNENKILNENGEPYRGACVSFPPRHGKSLTNEFYVKWKIGTDDIRILYMSYSQKVVDEFSGRIRNEIKSPINEDLSQLTYKDIFPNVDISKDQKAVSRWKKSNAKMLTMMTASFNTAVTGFGYDLAIMDDPHKNAAEAMSEKQLLDKWNAFSDTFISRVEGLGKWIIIQTRWSKDDIIGRLKADKEIAKDFYFLELKAINYDEDDNIVFLNPDIFDEKEYIFKKRMISDMIFEANYNQVIIDNKISLYENLKYWTELPDNGKFERVGVLDPSADGKDYTALVVGYNDSINNNFYIDNIFYNNEPITKIEDDLIEFIIENKITKLIIESNAAFAILVSNIKKALIIKNYKCNVIKFHQSKNKEVRLMTASKAVCETMYWNKRLIGTEAYNHFINFKGIIKDNINDDIEDAITLAWEKFIKQSVNNKLLVHNSRYAI